MDRKEVHHPPTPWEENQKSHSVQWKELKIDSKLEQKPGGKETAKTPKSSLKILKPKNKKGKPLKSKWKSKWESKKARFNLTEE